MIVLGAWIGVDWTWLAMAEPMAGLYRWDLRKGALFDMHNLCSTLGRMIFVSVRGANRWA